MIIHLAKNILNLSLVTKCNFRLAMKKATKDSVDTILLCVHEHYENLVEKMSDRNPIGFTILPRRAKVVADYGRVEKFENYLIRFIFYCLRLWNQGV
jgi:tRNA(Leu) C34 or U34 (ribose-2'-O)-methylase TrmL